MTNQPKDRITYVVGNLLRVVPGSAVPIPTGSELGYMYTNSTPLTREQYDYLRDILPGVFPDEPNSENDVYFYLFRAPKPYHINHGKVVDPAVLAKQLAKVKPFLSISRLNLSKGTYDSLLVRPGGGTLEDFRIFYDANRRAGMFFTALRALMAAGAEVKIIEYTEKPKPKDKPKKSQAQGPQPVQRKEKPQENGNGNGKPEHRQSRPPQQHSRPAPKPATHTLGSHWPTQPEVIDAAPAAVEVDPAPVVAVETGSSAPPVMVDASPVIEDSAPATDEGFGSADPLSDTSVDVSDTSVDVSSEG